MELKEFIRETLVQLIEGVKEAEVMVGEDNGQINPVPWHIGNELKNKNMITETDRLIHMVDFDIAVTATEGSGIKGGVGIFVGGVGIGTKGETNESNVSQNRIKFQVPVVFPFHKKTK